MSDGGPFKFIVVVFCCQLAVALDLMGELVGLAVGLAVVGLAVGLDVVGE